MLPRRCPSLVQTAHFGCSSQREHSTSDPLFRKPSYTIADDGVDVEALDGFRIGGNQITQVIPVLGFALSFLRLELVVVDDSGHDLVRTFIQLVDTAKVANVVFDILRSELQITALLIKRSQTYIRNTSSPARNRGMQVLATYPSMLNFSFFQLRNHLPSNICRKRERPFPVCCISSGT